MVRYNRSIGDQAAANDKSARRIDRRQTMLSRQGNDEFTGMRGKGRCRQDQCAVWRLREGSDEGSSYAGSRVSIGTTSTRDDEAAL